MSDKRTRVLIGSLGGEGGASVARWIVDAAQLEGHRVQSTSIPGVAQRTGATTYYIEIVAGADLDPAPQQAVASVLALAPSPGVVDLVLASELVEAGRALQSGYVSPDRTTLVMSTHRVFAVVEKAAMGDGRYPTDRIEQAAAVLARHLIAFDMAELARRHGVPVTVVLLGAAAATLPISRIAFERVIRASQRSAEESLQAFAAGWAAAAADASATSKAVARAAAPRLAPSSDILAPFPGPARATIELALRRLVDYQDQAYANLYLARLRLVADLDRLHGGERSAFALTIAVARHAALWMSYEDVPRVAQVKTRLDRLDQVRRDSGAAAGEPIKIYEFLKPGADEICALLPSRLAAALRRLLERRGWVDRLNVGMRIRTNALPGFLLLRAVAELRRIRRFGSRWKDEQRAIESWLAAVRAAAATSLELAAELAECGRLVKGYGDTHRRAKRNFGVLLEATQQGMAAGLDPDRNASFVRAAREAALADPDGMALDRVLAAHAAGATPPRSRATIMLRSVGHV